ncbi:YtxH domain-containing protein [Neobacillus niacini]|uniref:YtxH domain-containing protein n=1 Tax=Neobacillus niacini TaxID=86668 RepID=UPI002858825F|nr:YtxH domain-containing protein [Neobacillus niacini]MDR7000525.1 gas vesicle protein [Neobacillus niacini]
MSNKDNETRETNQKRNEDSGNRFLLGALIGGMVGVTAALFFAPKAGKDLRNKLSKQTGLFMEKTVDLRENLVNKSSLLASKTTSITQGMVQQSTDLLSKSKIKPKAKKEQEDKSEVIYIPIQAPREKRISLKTEAPLNSGDIKKKLEEAKKAFDEEELKVKQ